VSLAGRIPAHLVSERDEAGDFMAPQDRRKGNQEANDNQADLDAPQLPDLQLSPRARAALEIAFTILGFLYIALVIFQYYKLATGGVPDLCWEYAC
jgi:hypothetical protein